eukprot:Trichotokara_eunicae@DN5369_c0_g1_i1.p1
MMFCEEYQEAYCLKLVDDALLPRRLLEEEGVEDTKTLLQKMQIMLENVTPEKADELRTMLLDRLLEGYLSTVGEDLSEFDSEMTLAEADASLEAILSGLPELLRSSLVTGDLELVANKVALFDYLTERFGSMHLFKGEHDVTDDDESSSDILLKKMFIADILHRVY